MERRARSRSRLFYGAAGAALGALLGFAAGCWWIESATALTALCAACALVCGCFAAYSREDGFLARLTDVLWWLPF